MLTLHITDDIVRGISKAEPSNTALIVLVVFLYGTLVLAERRSGHVIMLLVGLFAAGMPVLHMRGAHYGEIARSAGGFFFVWTLWALGGLGGLTFILSARGLWSLRRGQPSVVMLLPIHIAAGGLAIVLGAVALLGEEGRDHPPPQRDAVRLRHAGHGHQRLDPGVSQESADGNVLAGFMTAYFVGTALTTVRPVSRWTRAYQRCWR